MRFWQYLEPAHPNWVMTRYPFVYQMQELKRLMIRQLK